MAKDTFHFKSPDKSPAQVIDVFRRFYGPTMNAFAAAEAKGKTADLLLELEGLFERENRSQTHTSIPATFLRVTVSV